MKNKFSDLKKIITLSLLILSLTSNATTYYFAANGNDNNNGTSASTPWETLTKFNSIFSSLKPGDNVLFNRGNVFYGTLTINKSGTSSAPITIGAYGTGANPVISGFTNVTAWTNLGSNIWESTGAISALKYTNMVVISGVNTPMGRYPNTGYFTFQTHGTHSITSSSLTGSTNWKGAEAGISNTPYNIIRCPITAQSGTTLTYTNNRNIPDTLFNTISSFYIPNFIIQNDPRTLDVKNEWYYNPSTKKIRIYGTTSPVNVQVSTVETLVSTGSSSYVTFDGISFQGANSSAIEANNSPHLVIKNCNFNFSGKNCIHGLLNNVLIQSCTINHTNSNAIDLTNSTQITISSCTITNTGTIVMGMEDGASKAEAITTRGDNELIEYNNIDSSGFSGIRFLGNNNVIQNNFVNHSCLVLYNGGGIYSFNSGNTNRSGNKILNNIVLNTPDKNGAIYMDDHSNGMLIQGNTAAFTKIGIYLHSAWNIQVFNNTTYSNDFGIMPNWNDVNIIANKLTIKNNIFFAATTAQKAGCFYTELAVTMPLPFTADSNYYARPMDDNLTIQTALLTSTVVQRDLAGWQKLNAQEAHSKKSPKTITNVSDLRFEYNATSSSKTISLPYNYIDVKNKSYNGTITLAPYTSAVLIKNGAATSGNKAPVSKAGSDQSVTLPTTTASLSGSGTDPDGTISAYSWTKISGPSGGTITSATSASTKLTALAQGVYKFQLKVTDNGGATDLDTVQVTVNASVTLLPAVNPANTVNGLNYKYYQATSYSALPDFSKVTPVKSGSSTNFDISLASRSESFAFQFTGYISVPSDGVYTFSTLSVDGSDMYIDTVHVVTNDKIHYNTEVSGTVGLKAGKHAISVGYFNQLGGKLLTVSYEGPGITKRAIPSSALYRVSTSGLVAMNNSQAVISTAQAGIKAYPNPFTNYIEINIAGGVAGEFKLLLVDALGRTVWVKNGVKNAGDFQESINTSALERGVYFLKIIQANTSSEIKLVK